MQTLKYEATVDSYSWQEINAEIKSQGRKATLKIDVPDLEMYPDSIRELGKWLIAAANMIDGDDADTPR